MFDSTFRPWSEVSWCEDACSEEPWLLYVFNHFGECSINAGSFWLFGTVLSVFSLFLAEFFFEKSCVSFQLFAMASQITLLFQRFQQAVAAGYKIFPKTYKVAERIVISSINCLPTPQLKLPNDENIQCLPIFLSHFLSFVNIK